MAYNLSITPSRGIIKTDTGRFGDPTYNHIPTGINGIPSEWGPAYIFSTTIGFKTVVRVQGADVSNTPERITLNNADPQLATSATIFSNSFYFSGITDTQKYYGMLVIRDVNDFSYWNAYKVTAATKNTSASPYEITTTLTFLGGNITSLSDMNQVILDYSYQEDNISQVTTYLGTPTTPLSFDGDADAINTILQSSASYFQWYDTFTAFTPDSGSFGRGTYSAPTIPTTDVAITFIITKNGTVYNSYTGYLKFKTWTDNPSGL